MESDFQCEKVVWDCILGSSQHQFLLSCFKTCLCVLPDETALCSSTELSVDSFIFGLLQAMAEMMAENYHNIWAKKKKMELESKGSIS